MASEYLPFLNNQLLESAWPELKLSRKEYREDFRQQMADYGARSPPEELKQNRMFLALQDMVAASGIRVHCLALGGVDLTSAAGTMTMQVISAVAEFEKDLLIERTHSGLARARAAGKRFGRPPALNQEQRQAALEHLKAGDSISAVAREFGTSRQTIMRLRDDAVTPELPE